MDNSLLLAAARGDLDTVERLLGNGSSANVENEQGITALSLAVVNDHREVAERLLQAGADVNHPLCEWTVLHAAALRGRAEIVPMLLSWGAAVNARDTEGYTPLHWATLGNHFPIVEALLNYHADLTLRDPEGKTALMIAEEEGFTEIVERLRRAEAERHAPLIER
jgi:ankyrin repeat protein